MSSDPRLVQARSLHQASLEQDAAGKRLRDQRDQLVRQLRAEDPSVWTYPRLAHAIGCSPELIAYIVNNRAGRRR